jgi:hypothetical protein
MIKYFVCLANSYKPGGRCIAGIELEKIDNDNFSPIRENGEPKWIRPVSRIGQGGVATNLVNQINLLDIVETNVTEFCPNGYQSENVYFDENSIRVIRKINTPNESVETLVTNREGMIFGNLTKTLVDEEVQSLDHSLLLVKPSSFKTYFEDGGFKTDFIFNGINNRFIKITDPKFITAIGEDEDLLDNYQNIFLTISLGVRYPKNGRYYKLVAGVIYF